MVKPTHIHYFYYDGTTPVSLTYNGSTYYYITNLQGDVVATTSISYTYDAWGNLLFASDNEFAQNNPLRYRGYVYDSESGLYYLQSRYYDPAIGRFLNADAYASTGQGVIGNNMFAYCNNNSVNLADPSGHAAGWTNLEVICDGGCGLSTEELRMLRMIKYATDGIVNEDTLGISDGVACEITKGSAAKTIDPISKGIMGDYDNGLVLGTAGLIVGAHLEITAATIVSGAILVVPIAVSQLANYEDPGLLEGTYTVYNVDVTISRTPYVNQANGMTEIVESHYLTTVYILAEPVGGTVRHVVTSEECYTVCIYP